MAALDLQILGKFMQIWTEKKWTFPTPVESSKVFNTFSEILSELNKEEQLLFLELTRSYSRYSFTDYQALVVKAFSKIEAKNLVGVKQVLLVPLLNPDDDKVRDAKSGHVLLYPAEHIGIPSNQIFQGISVNALSTSDSIADNVGKTTTLVILLDDFIGSGDTAKYGILQCKDSIKKEDRIIVISLVAMEHAIARLEGDYGVPVICGEILVKGIEENVNIQDKRLAYQIIDGIEQRIDITRDYRRGYRKSEALVSMVRTPDNTFPMYWCDRRDGGGKWPAPFPR
jgi:hypothetical protein